MREVDQALSRAYALRDATLTRPVPPPPRFDPRLRLRTGSNGRRWSGRSSAPTATGSLDWPTP